jgi:hypothetical protein
VYCILQWLVLLATYTGEYTTTFMRVSALFCFGGACFEVILGTFLMYEVYSGAKGEGSSGFHAESQPGTGGTGGGFSGDISGSAEPKASGGSRTEDASLYGSTGTSGSGTYT